MKCDCCGCEISAEFLKVSRGYCNTCDERIADQLLAYLHRASEAERAKLTDQLIAEAISRNIDERIWNQA